MEQFSLQYVYKIIIRSTIRFISIIFQHFKEIIEWQLEIQDLCLFLVLL